MAATINQRLDQQQEEPSIETVPPGLESQPIPKTKPFPETNYSPETKPSSETMAISETKAEANNNVESYSRPNNNNIFTILKSDHQIPSHISQLDSTACESSRTVWVSRI